jgi:hypothetical protein
LGGNVIVEAIAYQTLSVNQTRTGKQYKYFAYRLSVVGSVAPPGTAWGAEGLRGNEANENKIMLLVGALARKCQSGPVLHKRSLPEGFVAGLASGARTPFDPTSVF